MFFLGGSVLSAPYQSIFGSKNTFSIITYAVNGFTAVDTFFITSDTTIAGNTYKKISTRYETLAAIREDTNTGKIWMRSFMHPIAAPKDTMETLVVDYSLQKGDTFNIEECRDPSSGIGNIVDSVYYMNGMKHIRFKASITNKTEKFEFIEGIGTNKSFMYKYCGGEWLFAFYLLCAYKDNTLQYVNQYYAGNCNPNLSVKNSPHATFNIYPNPSNGLFNIQLENNILINANLQVYDCTGKVCYSTQINGKQLRISLNKQAGLYLIKLQAGDIILTKLVRIE